MIIGGIDFKKLNSLSELDEGSSLSLRNSRLDNKSGPVITDNDVIEIFKECYANRFGIEVHTDSYHPNYSTKQIEKDISIRISDFGDSNFEKLCGILTSILPNDIEVFLNVGTKGIIVSSSVPTEESQNLYYS